MELHFHAPVVRWLAAQEAPELAPSRVADAVVTVSVPVRDQASNEIRSHELKLPGQLKLPFEDEQALLKRPVSFTLAVDGKQVSVHKVTLGDCIPILQESQIEWQAQITQTKQVTEAHVTVPITTNRRPREAIANALAYRDQAISLAEKLALHKNTVAIGLLPPILGCFAGVILTTPLWLPLTLVIGILGFPLWLVVGVCGSLLIAISAISSVITVKAIQSRRVKSSIRELAQSPGGQYVLFANSGNTKLPSPSEIAHRAKIYVNADPSRKLIASLVVDFIGNATFVVPGIGELADLFWAPASATFVSAMYSESTPSAKYFAFIEEFLPFTDFIPTATLAWLKENLNKDDFLRMVGRARVKKE